MKMLTVVDGRRGGRVESKNVKVLLLAEEGEGGLKKIKLLTVVDGRKVHYQHSTCKTSLSGIYTASPS